MSEKETKVINNFERLKDGATVTVLHGKAPDPENQSSYKYNGRIDAPGNYYDARKDMDQFNMQDCALLVNYEERSITLDIFPEYKSRHVEITGVLELDHQLARFGINGTKTYTRRELAKLFKFNRDAFSLQSEGMEFVKLLKDFELKYDQTFGDKDNDRGNKKLTIERVIKECSIPEFITLSLPVFKGQEKERIVVDVLFAVEGHGDVVFYLESPALAEKIDGESVEIINTEVTRFIGVAVIYS